MRKKNLLLFLTFILFGNIFSQVIENRISVYFESDEYTLQTFEEEKLKNIDTILNYDSIIEVLITGNTDNSADSLYNIELSKKRCISVLNYFISQDFDKKIFKISFLGENKPLASNASSEGKMKNRRVDVSVKHWNRQTIEETVTKELLVKDSCLTSDTTISLENGTELIFDKCEYIKIKDCLEIKSIRTIDDILENNIGLRTIDRFYLRTCGMIGLCLSPECKLESNCLNQPVKVRFPFPKEDKECLPCKRREVGVFNFSSNGNWSNDENEKIEVLEIENTFYYQFTLKCLECNYVNCDCKKCAYSDKKEFRKRCPKIRLIIPKKYALISAQILIDCPTNMIYFESDTSKKKRKHIAKAKSECYEGNHKFRALALNGQNDTIHVNLTPIENIKHSLLYSKCKSKKEDEITDNQKIFGLFNVKKRFISRKYILKKKDFSLGNYK